MFLYSLLIIIAIGVLLVSQPGRVLLGIMLSIGIIALVIYVGYYCALFVFAIYLKIQEHIPSKSDYDWIPGVIIGVGFLGAAIYKALYPLGYDKNRQIWTGRLKSSNSNENQN